MKNIKKILFLCGFLVFLLFSASCADTEKSRVVSAVEITGEIKAVYAIDEPIDVDVLSVILSYDDGTTETLSVHDPRVIVSGADTSAAGEGALTVAYEGFSKKFSFVVRQYLVTFDFSGGTYDGKTSLQKEAAGFSVSASGISPATEDGKLFAGWFFDRELRERAEINADGMIFIDGDVTLYAGYDFDYSDKFAYEIEDGAVALTALNPGTFLFADSLEIPATVELYPVKKLGDDFMNPVFLFSRIVTLSFAEGSVLEEIGERAFEYTAISSVSFPQSLRKIGANAFNGSSLKGALVLPKNLRRIEDNAFNGGYQKLLENVTCEEGCELTYIGESAFAGQSGLKSFQFPDKLEEIMASAFLECRELTRISLPASLRQIGLNAFGALTKLTDIEVASGNSYFYSESGNLYQREGARSTLIVYCFGKTDSVFTLPNYVRKIGESAFRLRPSDSYCALKKIVLNEGLESIGANAFAYCDVTFTLPASLKEISIDAFCFWPGKEFLIAEDSEVFAVSDGCLYSKDMTKLYAVPQNSENVHLVLPDSVTTIMGGALSNNNTVETLTISENSALTEVYESGLAFFSCLALHTVYIDKTEPFRLVHDACHSDSASIIKDTLFIYLSSTNKDAYLAAWAEYDELVSVENEKILPLIATKDDNLTLATDFLTELGFTPFRYYLAGFNVRFSSYVDDIIYDLASFFRTIEGLYPLLEESDSTYHDYFREVEKLIFDAAGHDRDRVDNDTLRRRCELLRDHYYALPQSMRENLSENMAWVEEKLTAFTENDRKFASLQNEIADLTIDPASFDKEYFLTLQTRVESYGGENYLSNDTAYFKYSALKASYLVDILLSDAYEEITVSNRNEIYALIYGGTEGEYYLGIQSYLEFTLTSEADKALIYRYADYVGKKTAFDDFCSSCYLAVAEAVESFDFSPENFDKDKYLALYGNIMALGNDMSRFYYNDYYEEVTRIFLVRDMLSLLDSYPELTDENYLDVYENWILPINAILDRDTTGFFASLSVTAAYTAYAEQATTKVMNDLQYVFDGVDAFDFGKNGRDEARATYERLFTAANRLGGILFQMDPDNYIHKLDVMTIWYLIDDFAASRPADSDPTEEFFFALEDFLYSHYDYEENAYVYGMSYYVSLLESTDELPNYDVYAAYLNRYENYPAQKS